MVGMSPAPFDGMKRFLSGAALVSLLIGCGEARPAAHEVMTTDTTRSVGSTYAVGTSVTNEGAIVADSAGDTFRRGPGIFLSIDVASASTTQTIDVQWIDPFGRVALHEMRLVREGAHYAAFSSGDTSAWKPGPYRAVISINERTVNETRFALL